MTNTKPVGRARAIGVATLAGLALIGSACSDGDAGADAKHDHHPTEDHYETSAPAAARPEVTFSAGNEVIDIPAEVPSGFVDIRIVALESGANHLAIFRLDDGKTIDEFEAASDAEKLAIAEFYGGNGTIEPGDETLLTLDLEPGHYVVANIYFTGGPPQFAFDDFIAIDEGNAAPAPEEKGTITLGPGMRIDIPAEFDADGVWRFENVDTEWAHEAALVRLADGKTVEDLIVWAGDPASAPPPMIGELGSMGSMGPGREGWITFDGDLEPGTYALVCFVPGEDGEQHLADGMATEITIA